SFVGLDVTRDGTRFIWGGAYDNFDQSRDIFLGTGVKTAVNMSADVRPSAKSALYQGKTPNADHVVFALYPPFGQPDPPELFEYTDGSPRPVGILPGETTPNPSGAVLGSFERNY